MILKHRWLAVWRGRRFDIYPDEPMMKGFAELVTTMRAEDAEYNDSAELYDVGLNWTGAMDLTVTKVGLLVLATSESKSDFFIIRDGAVVLRSF